MNKREALLQYLESNESGGYTPAAFFLHFGNGYRSGEAAIRRHREFFEFTGMDFCKIQLELELPHFEIGSGADFGRLPSLPLDVFQSQLDVVRGLVVALKAETLVVLTLYSPLMIVDHLVGQPTVNEWIEKEPEHVFKGLEIATESLVDFVRECAKIGIDGFYHSTQGGEAHRFSKRETFFKYVKPTDHRVMNEIDELCSFNILHICDYHKEYGGYADLEPFLDYPGHVVNVSTEVGGGHRTPAELSTQFGRPYMGGLDRLGPLSSGTEDEARAAARAVLADAPPRFILGADCTVPADTRWENLRAAIDEAHAGGR